MRGTDKKHPPLGAEDFTAREDLDAGKAGAAGDVQDVAGHTADSAMQIIETERDPDLAATIQLLEALQEALGGRDPKLVEKLLDLTANTYAIAQPLLSQNGDAGTEDTNVAVAKVADIFLAKLQEHLPSGEAGKLQNGRTDLASLLDNLNSRSRASAKPEDPKGQRRGGRTSFRRMLTLAGVLGLAACNSNTATPPKQQSHAANSSQTHRLGRSHFGPDGRGLDDQPSSTGGQVTEWFEGTWKKVTGGHGKETSGESSRPFKLPVIPTALALIWALALATDKFKWDDRVLIGGSTLALIADACGNLLLDFSGSLGVNLNPIKLVLGPTWWWLLEDAWVIASLKYLQDGPLKDRKALHYILGAGIWVALGYMNR